MIGIRQNYSARLRAMFAVIALLDRFHFRIHQPRQHLIGCLRDGLLHNKKVTAVAARLALPSKGNLMTARASTKRM